MLILRWYLLWVWVLVIPVQAQDPSTVASDLLPDEVAEVTITTTRNRLEPVFQVPTAVTVIGSRLQELSGGTLVDLLKGEPGVWVQSSGPGQGTAYVRGVTGREVLLLQDGFRVSPAFTRSGPNQYLALFDPFAVARLEVVRGPSSVLYGSDALGGAVNVIPVLPTGTASFTGRVLTGFASATSEKTGRVELTNQNFHLGLTYRDFEDVRLGAGASAQLFFPNADPRLISGTGYEFSAADTGVVLDLGENQRLTLTGQYSQIPRLSAIDSLIQGYGSVVNDVVNQLGPQSRTFVSLSYEARPDWLEKVRLTLGYQGIQDDRLRRPYRVRPSFPYDSGIPETYQDQEQNRSDLLGATLTLTSLPSPQHTLTYGGEFYRDTIGSQRVRQADAGTITPRAARYVNGAVSTQGGLFAQDEIRWDDRFTTNLGLRFSALNAEIPADSLRAAPGFNNSTADLSFNLGLAYLLNPDLNLVLNLGQGFRAPNLSDLSQAGPEGSFYNSPNPALKPERVLSLDLGLKWNAPQFDGEIFGFYSQYQDRILNIATGQQLDGRDERRLENVGSQVIGGVEFRGQFRFSPQWTLTSSATWTQGDTTLTNGTSVPADRIPPFNGLVGVRWTDDYTYVEPYLRYASAQYRLAPNNLTDNRINPNGTPGFALLNLRAGYQLTPDLGLRLTAENLANTTYREHGSSLDGLGTNIAVTLDYRY
ncbi:TonB-dependent receptor [Candidatus Cyanaurora vandensis]|uniref:TonB-dependent receptor n=1 Tax=Candidatus Cyanaurora vandensis TaxID=2714958 RepID=UPI00257C4DA4|nr:TonB-dependent receptor [Candidatus Cyanaurora vandensis]